MEKAIRPKMKVLALQIEKSGKQIINIFDQPLNKASGYFSKSARNVGCHSAWVCLRIDANTTVRAGFEDLLLLECFGLLSS